MKDLEMAKQQLQNLHANVMDLLEHMEECPDCPLLSQAWVQSKLTLSEAYVDSVRDYVINSHADGPGSLKSMEKEEGSGEDGYQGYDDYDDPESNTSGGFLIAIERGVKKY
jgi:hypothetical protein